MKRRLLILTFVLPFALHAQNKITETEDAVYKNLIAGDNSTKSLAINYKQRHLKKIQTLITVGGKVREDARFTWFSWHIIDSIRAVAAASISTCDSLTGIRFYYGQYPKEYLVNGINYGKRHTLIIVPTKYEFQVGQSKPINRDISKKIRNKLTGESKSIYIVLYADKQVISQNHGDMCPPPSNNCSGCDFINEQ